MAYSKFYSDWKGAPDTSTPITEDALDHIEDGIVAAHITADAAVAKSLVAAKGDIIVATANDTVTNKTVGANGTFLKADSTQTDGLIWQALTAVEVMTALGTNLGVGTTTPARWTTATGPYFHVRGTTKPQIWVESSAVTSDIAYLALTGRDGGGTAHHGSLAMDGTTLTIGTSAAEPITFSSGIILADAINIGVNTSTGTKIGTATTQKLGFFNVTPVVQPANTTDLRAVLINLGLLATGGATPLDLNGGALTTANHTFADGANIIVNATTGTKIGTATTQKIGFWNATPVVRQGTYSVSNRTTDRTYDCNSTSLDELADIIGTLILDLQTEGLIG